MVLQKDSFVLCEILSLLGRVCYAVLKLDLWELHQYSSVRTTPIFFCQNYTNILLLDLHQYSSVGTTPIFFCQNYTNILLSYWPHSQFFTCIRSLFSLKRWWSVRKHIKHTRHTCFVLVHTYFELLLGMSDDVMCVQVCKRASSYHE
jgi:hypothetical protein